MDLSIASLFTVAGKTAIVTGGSSGIGAMIAATLAANGVRVTIVGRKADRLEAIANEIQCGWFVADLTEPEEVSRLAASVDGPVDILVNNAGASWGAGFEDFPLSGYDKVFALNARTPFLLTQALLPQLKMRASAEDFSRVINISSVGARMIGDAPSIAYGPSKAAIEQMTRVMARLLGPVRGEEAADVDAWVDMAMRLGEEMVRPGSAVVSVDVNPVMLRRGAGAGATAADAVVLAGDGATS